MATLREQNLGDKAGAFTVYADAVRASVAEPELPDLVKNLDRLAAELGREGDLISIFKEVAPDVLDGDLQRRLYLDIADLARALHDDESLAREYYQLVLDGAPDDARALAALESIYRNAGEHQRLYDVLSRKAELAGDRFDVRVAALAEAAALCGGDLNRPDEAAMAWEQVLEIAPDNKEAAAALEKLYTKATRWHDLVNLTERRLGFAFTVEEAVALRFRLGEIYEQHLLDPDSAVENYSAALGGDPNHSAATTALERALDDPGSRTAAAEVLEPIYVSRQDWPKLVRIYEIKLEAAEDPSDRLRLTRYIARLYEEQLEDLEGAFRWYGRVFRESPADKGIRDQLGRLATILEAWAGLANVYQEYLDDEPGEVPEARSVALTLAELYDRRLDEVELGQSAYRRALQSEPDDLATFERLESMLIRAQRWFALVDCYEESIEATLDEGRRTDLHLRVARVQRDHLKDAARAVEGLRAVLDIDPDHPAANQELDALYEAQSQWYELADLLLSRISRAEQPEIRNGLRMRLAGVRENRLEDVQAAIDQYEEVLRSGVGLEQALPQLERLVVNEDVRERIADLLEPVYREHDWWQKLVVILDAKLKFVDDPERRVAMLREIAQMHETRGGDQRLALEALSSAWKAAPGSNEVLAELTVLATKLAAWDQLVATLEEGVKGSYDYDLNSRILARIAEVHEHQRRDHKKAIAAWKRVLEVSDEEPAALESLDRLYSAEKLPAELVSVLQRRADAASTEAARVALLHRIADLQERELRNPTEAIAAYRAVLNVADADGAALDALERLYRGEEDWSELSSILLRRIELTTDPDARRALRFSAAEVSDSRLNDAFEAIAQLNAVLDDDSSDTEALAELDRIFQRDQMWIELVDVLDKRAELEVDVAARAELGFRAADVVGKELLDLERSLDRYAMVLQVDPKHPGARKALDALTRNEDMLARASAVLERLYLNEADFDAVAALYERRLAVPAHDLELRKQQYARLVELHEVSRGDPASAFAVLARAMAEAPDDTRVHAELERLAATRGSWDELVELFEKRLADTMDAELEYVFAAKLASLYEEALGDLDRAASCWRRALDVANDEREPLAALDRIYGRASKFEELAEILAREAEASLDADEQASFLFRLGDVREQSLEDPAGAVSAYRDVLDRLPGHGAARGALERMMAHEAERREIVGILEPLYEGEGEWGRLADLLVAKLSVTDDPFDRALTYGRVAEISERELADPVRALDAVGGWLAEDPRSDRALAELGRLAEVCNRWDEVAARLRGIIDAADADDVRRPLLLELGEVQLDSQGDSDAAEGTYRTVLDIDPECGPALVALDRIYRHRNDTPALAEIVWRRGQLAFDATHKRQAFVEVAQLREQLEDVAGAIQAWREVMDLDEGDREAHTRLAALHEHSKQWPELIDLLGTAARFAGGVAEEAAVRTRIAQLYTTTLEDLGAAVDAWQTVLDIDPESPLALEALLDVHARREDWLAVQEVLTRKLDMVSRDAERIEIYLQLADIAFNKRESADDAIGYLYQILDLDNAHFDTYKRLERVLSKSERWHDLVELLEREGDVYGTLGHSREEIDCLARAADVFEGPLENPDAAGEILEKIIRREPNYVPALTRLSKIYEAAGEWDRCSEVLQRAASFGPTGQDAAELYYRLGEVERHKGGDENLALARQYWTQALQQAPHHLPSVTAFERLARDDQDWPLVADLVARREAVSEDPSEKLELGLELATLYGRKLGQPQQAIPLLERAAQIAPADPRVLGPLADLYFQARMHDRAAPIYEKLAEEARKGRRMKDVAMYRQRQAGILESQGDIDGALAAYEEAFRVNPTDAETMAGLGRIYMAREAWDKARRVYRSMVLQNLDPDLGVSKAEVYFNLGTIHLHMNEPAKAKGMFQRGLELEPNNAKLQQALAQI
ncbi:MAG TPA: tetratricopeptide repeat protein [Kofleriaceae bacterium]|nr:tetratricopeptide repeat protein [Kofleriaceae bacterium]